MKNQQITGAMLRAKKIGGCELILLNQEGQQILVPFASAQSEGNFMKQAAMDNSCSGRFLEFLTEKGVALTPETTNRIAILEDGAILLNEAPPVEDLDFEHSKTIWNGPPDRGWITILAYLSILAGLATLCYFAALDKVAMLNAMQP